jgi:hypothetical protein
METDLAERLRESLRSPWAAGIIAGSIGLLLSFGLRGLSIARPLGDPLPLTLSLGQLTRGLTYFPWRPILAHLIFALVLGALSFAFLLLISWDSASGDQAAKTGRIAAAINVGIVAILSVDAAVVGFWYLVAGLVSVVITGFAARFSAFLWRRRDRIERTTDS